MKVIGQIADRFLSAVVPDIAAGACCTLSGKKYTNTKCVKKGVGARQSCVVTCDCQASCGPWVDYANSGCL